MLRRESKNEGEAVRGRLGEEGKRERGEHSEEGIGQG